MKIEIAKTDLWALRELLRDAIWQKENCPNPSAWGKTPMAGRKAYKAIVKAQIKAFGHDWNADKAYFPKVASQAQAVTSRPASVDYEYCPVCYGRFTFRKPFKGVRCWFCCWCGAPLNRSPAVQADTKAKGVDSISFVWHCMSRRKNGNRNKRK